MILVIDNYDSFTWNLVHLVRVLGREVRVVRNDEMSAADALAIPSDGILISPGPGRPEESGISLEIVAGCAAADRPLLGVCLGHQAIAQHFGSSIVPAPKVMHGKSSRIDHDGTSVFRGLPSPFSAVRYHSLTVALDLPDCLRVTATAQDGTIQGLEHRHLPIHGIQFHPESIGSEQGRTLLANFVHSTARESNHRAGPFSASPIA